MSCFYARLPSRGWRIVVILNTRLYSNNNSLVTLSSAPARTLVRTPRSGSRHHVLLNRLAEPLHRGGKAPPRRPLSGRPQPKAGHGKLPRVGVFFVAVVLHPRFCSVRPGGRQWRPEGKQEAGCAEPAAAILGKIGCRVRGRRRRKARTGEGKREPGGRGEERWLRFGCYRRGGR